MPDKALLATASASRRFLYHSRKLAFESIKINSGPRSPLDRTRQLAEILKIKGNTISLHVKDLCVFYLHDGLLVSSGEKRIPSASSSQGMSSNGSGSSSSERQHHDNQLALGSSSQHGTGADDATNGNAATDTDEEGSESEDGKDDATVDARNDIIRACMSVHLPRVMRCLPSLKTFKLQIERSPPSSVTEWWEDLWDTDFRFAFESIIEQPKFTGLWVQGLPLLMPILAESGNKNFKDLHLRFVNFIQGSPQAFPTSSALSLSKLHIQDWSSRGELPWERGCTSFSTVTDASFWVSKQIIRRNILPGLFGQFKASLQRLSLTLSGDACK